MKKKVFLKFFAFIGVCAVVWSGCPTVGNTVHATIGEPDFSANALVLPSENVSELSLNENALLEGSALMDGPRTKVFLSATKSLTSEEPPEPDAKYDYYDDSLSAQELYCNEADIAEFPAVQFGETTEEPMLASYVGDDYWGDHRQFARMAPVETNLTAGDSVAKIILQSDDDYWLVEYLVNTAAEDSEEITGLKLFIDFPEHMRAGEENHLYAYLNSDNDAGGSRVCRIDMVCDEEIWIRPVEQTMAGIAFREAENETTFFSDLDLGMKNYHGEMRIALTMDWPETFNIQGGISNGYFAMTMLETFSENPAQNVIHAKTKEEADTLIGDTEFVDGYEEYTPHVDEAVELDTETTEAVVAKSPLWHIIWIAPLTIIISIIICGRKLWTIIKHGKDSEE